MLGISKHNDSMSEGKKIASLWENLNHERGGKTKRILVVSLSILVVLLLLCLILSGVWSHHSTERRKAAYLKEIELFIKNKKFERAAESIQITKELIPDHPQLQVLERSYHRVKAVDRIEKEVEAEIQRRNWESARTLLSEITVHDQAYDTAITLQKINAGELAHQTSGYLTELRQARAEGDLPNIVKLTQTLLSLNPQHASAARWQEYGNQAEAEMRGNEQKAEALFRQAQQLDKGVYNEQVLFLANQARKTGSKPVYTEFYDKVKQYPRVFKYPGEFSNLQDAIDLARPVDSIRVAPGSHFSPIIVNKEVRLYGESAGETILHCSGKHSSVIYIGPKGNLKANNLVIRHSELAKGEEAFSLVVVEGQASFASCIFYDSSAHGLHVIDGGQTLLESCRVEGNRWDGIAVSGAGSQLTTDGCIITRNEHHGIDVWDGGQLTFDQSFSEENERSGVFATNEVQLSLSQSTLRRNLHAGLTLHNPTRVEIQECEFSANHKSGVYGAGGGEVSFSECNVYDNSFAGVIMAEGAEWTGLESIDYRDNRGENLISDYDGSRQLYAEVPPEPAIVVEETTVEESSPETADDTQAAVVVDEGVDDTQDGMPENEVIPQAAIVVEDTIKVDEAPVPAIVVEDANDNQ